MKIPIELSRKKSAYSVYVYGALDVRLFPNKCLNVDLKNIEIWVSHGLKKLFHHKKTGMHTKHMNGNDYTTQLFRLLFYQKVVCK